MLVADARGRFIPTLKDGDFPAPWPHRIKKSSKKLLGSSQRAKHP
ncbi:hypothetical protein [Methanocella conradii]|nr:hypothetical protein [Methanocella conradii]